jgi:hypothetical protein
MIMGQYIRRAHSLAIEFMMVRDPEIASANENVREFSHIGPMVEAQLSPLLDR